MYIPDQNIAAAARWFNDNWEDAFERPSAALREKFGLQFSQIIAVIAEAERIERRERPIAAFEKPSIYIRISPWRCDEDRNGGPYQIDLVTPGRVVPCARTDSRDYAQWLSEFQCARFGLDLIIEW